MEALHARRRAARPAQARGDRERADGRPGRRSRRPAGARRLGVEISIDDFGTGYSSLAYLADLPVSEVKIDRSFVSRMATGSGERIIVNSTIDLAHHLGLRAVAEGVDDLALLPQLTRLGCDVVQGYAISRPLAGAGVPPVAE